MATKLSIESTDTVYRDPQLSATTMEGVAVDCWQASQCGRCCVGLRTPSPGTHPPYQLVEDNSAFNAHLAADRTALPAYVEREFDEYPKCGPHRARFPAGAFRDLSCRALCGVQLLTVGLLRQLRRAAHGRERGPAGGLGLSRTACAPPLRVRWWEGIGGSLSVRKSILH